MRIERVIINNFRQLRELDIDFRKGQENDLHVFIGQNGAGKSNIMNAINWCLYKEEPHLSSESQALPLMNLATIDDCNQFEIRDVDVEVWVKTDDLKTIVFHRRESQNVLEKTGKNPITIDMDFQVRMTDDTYNTEVYRDDEATKFRERFVPEAIREFFFFDGERLDKYFIDATGQKISKATFEISQINLLKTVEDRLKTMIDDLSKVAGKNNPQIDLLQDEVQKLEDDLARKLGEIEGCKKQISNSLETIKKCSEFVDGIPDLEEYEKRRGELKELINDKETARSLKLKKKQDILMEYGKLIYLFPIIKHSVDLIQEKKENNELPPNIDPDVLKETLKINSCLACGQDLDAQARDKISNLLKKMKVSSDVAQQLMSIEGSLKTQLIRMQGFMEKIREVTQDIKAFERDLENLNNEKNNIDKVFAGYSDVEMIKEMHLRRKQHEELLEKNKRKLWNLENQEKDIIAKHTEKKNERIKALEKDEKQKKLRKRIEFCEKARDVIIKSKEHIMDEIRKKIEAETKELFFRLVWKKNTFKDVKIDENYNINLIHNMGYECLGSISAAERGLLALSFTLALHKVSGFESPLIIDTPVSRVSDTNRINFADVLVEVSKTKQVVLLFTPDEYSENIQDIFDIAASTKNKLTPVVEEIETGIKAVI